MGEKELAAFRERWKRELWCQKVERRLGHSSSSSSRSENSDASPGKSEGKSENASGVEEPGYVSIARGLLGGRTSPLLERLEEQRIKRKKKYRDDTDCYRESLRYPQKKVEKDEQLVDQLIVDLNEANDIPFFDMELPYELALKIFQYLNHTDLGRCAQVSRVWQALAEDDVLWFRLFAADGLRRDAIVSDSPCWKATLRDCRIAAANVRANWKNRIGCISQLQFELGKVLCDVSSCDNYVLAGYSSGDTRLWNTSHWDLPSSYLKSNRLSALSEPRPHVTHVQVAGDVAAAAYRDGCVDLWSTQMGGEPIYYHQTAGVHEALVLSLDGSVLASATDCDVRLDGADDCGTWKMLSLIRLPKPVYNLVLVPGSRGQRRALTAAAAGESVYLLDEEEEPRTLHSVYGHPVTCLDASEQLVALGVKHSSWTMHDGGNKIHVYNIETGKALACVGDAPGDFTCVQFDDVSAPHMMLCGNKDRRVRVFDLRLGLCVSSLYAHQLGVTSVRGDDWKVVSGGGEGLVCVWEMRMGSKLWEMHNRHPVKYISFDSHTLLTANIPDDKTPRGACITDDDLTAHRRHRGVICHYDFSEDTEARESVLPICRSDYDQSHGYNYNIALAMPYDYLR
ncbi:F-box/WD repeat-containing protein 8-like isoform X1 [Corythoichthys intestinalis]|uniref:F-box/WD repeat-containing protein 8-like isoform X1 n=1 Tax=Corythoichthys intestinalis TaxID=161448 RepID=UPI0025A5A6D2|nr:F-box/WD repeat-containing protein 8-like isoform X1 [Corythoichthys intestinalis]XP_061811417.1 F-box/WD repeat-containing protein 8-like [Nerophis lumbriciformis]